MDDEVIVSKAEWEALQATVNDNTVLADKIEAYAKRIEELLFENQQLRLENEIRSEPTRKIPKRDVKENPLIEEASRAKKGDAVHIRSQVSRRKVFQAIDTNVIHVRNRLLESGCSNFEVRQSGVNAPVKVNCDIIAAGLVRVALKKNSVSFHEYKLAEEKSKCFLIKELVGLVDTDLLDVKFRLIECGLPEGIDVSFYTSGHMRTDFKQNSNVFVKLILPPGADVEVVQKVKSLNYVAVHFDEFKSKRILQCKNCQRFGHSAGGCQHQYRCVKCGANHLREECPRTLNKLIK